MLKRLINYNDERSLAFKFRQRRAHRIKALIARCYEEYGEVRVLDIGGTAFYWKIIPNDFLVKHNVHITLMNLSIGRETNPNPDYFTFAIGNGCDMPQYPDHSFHLAHSNSVIEHVGGGENITRFASELKRVAHYHYLQTPNYWFPIEPHFLTIGLHWLPRSWKIWLLMRFNLGWAKRRRDYNIAANLIDENVLIRPGVIRFLFL